MIPAVFLALAPVAMPDPAAPWEAVEACALLTADRANATAVVVGQKDGFAYLLTAYHAVPKDTDIKLQFYQRSSYPGPARTIGDCKVVAIFPQSDFALLKVPSGETTFSVLTLAPPRPRPLKLPFTALSIGCSRGEPPTGNFETVSAKRFGRRNGGEQAFFWETESAPTPGRSGGALLVDGAVVGLCVAEKDGRGYYAHCDELLAGLKAKGYGWLWEER